MSPGQLSQAAWAQSPADRRRRGHMKPDEGRLSLICVTLHDGEVSFGGIGSGWVTAIALYFGSNFDIHSKYSGISFVEFLYVTIS